MLTVEDILVATDFSPCSERALQEGFALAAAFDARVHLVHVTATPLHETWAGYVSADDYAAVLAAHGRDSRERLAAAAARYGGPQHGAELVALYGAPVEEILEYARDHGVDLIVCGTHGRRGLERFVMGSVAERIVQMAPCPVLSVSAERAERAPAA